MRRIERSPVAILMFVSMVSVALTLIPGVRDSTLGFPFPVIDLSPIRVASKTFSIEQMWQTGEIGALRLVQGKPEYRWIRLAPNMVFAISLRWLACHALIAALVAVVCRRLLILWRRSRQEPWACAECGYDTRHCVEGRCSECGQPLSGNRIRE